MILEPRKGRHKIMSNVGDRYQTATCDTIKIDTWSLSLVPGTQHLQPLESLKARVMCMLMR